MKIYTLLFFQLLLASAVYAQDEVVRSKPETFDDDSYGEGGKREVKTEDYKGIREIHTTYIDPEKNIQETRIVKIDIKTGYTIDSSVVTFVEGEQTIIEKYQIKWGNKGVQESEKYKYEWKTVNGVKQAVIIKADKTTYYESEGTKHYKYNLRTKKFENPNNIDASTNSINSVNITLHGIPKAEFYLGYSYMRAQDGARVLSMPLGANAGLVYNLNSRLGLAIDASYHYKKDGDQKFDKEFLLTGIQYRLKGDCCNEDDVPPGLFTHLLIGYARDGFRYMDTKNSSGAFAAAVGGGINIKLSNKASLQVKSDAKSVIANGQMSTYWATGIGLKWGGSNESPHEKYDRAFHPTKN